MRLAYHARDSIGGKRAGGANSSQVERMVEAQVAFARHRFGDWHTRAVHKLT